MVQQRILFTLLLRLMNILSDRVLSEVKGGSDKKICERLNLHRKISITWCIIDYQFAQLLIVTIVVVTVQKCFSKFYHAESKVFRTNKNDGNNVSALEYYIEKNTFSSNTVIKSTSPSK
jgi:hypothetical protein